MSRRKKARKGSRVVVNKLGAGGIVMAGDRGTVIDASLGDFALVVLDKGGSRVAINHVGLDPLSALDKMAEALNE